MTGERSFALSFIEGLGQNAENPNCSRGSRLGPRTAARLTACFLNVRASLEFSAVV
jgi:hypothetical protein